MRKENIMKRLILLAMVFLAAFMLGAKEESNTLVTSGTYLTSTGDTAKWEPFTAMPAIYLGSGTGSITITQSEAAEVARRYVSIWIIDQDENVPLEKSLIYEKTMLWTDKTPDELRADIPLNALLEKHNKLRETLKNKEDKPLKRIRLRDLQVIIRNW